MRKNLLYVSLFINIVALLFVARRLYYMGIDGRLQINNYLPWHKNDIVFFGDSEIERFDLSAFFPGVSIKNRGKSGDTVKGAYERLPEIINNHPEKLFIEIGTNDIRLGIAPNTSLNYMVDIIKMCKRVSPETAVYIQSVLPTHSGRNDIIIDYNNKLKSICQGYKVQYINLYDSFEDGGFLKKDYDHGDGYHLNENGYLLWRKLLKPYI